MTQASDGELPEAITRIGSVTDQHVAMQLHAMAVLQASGWFQQGVMMLDQIRKSMVITDDELCWYIPAGVLGEESLKGATLWGLPIYEATAGTPPGIGFPLTICSGNRDCKAHTEPPRQVDRLWIPWARQHKVEIT